MQYVRDLGHWCPVTRLYVDETSGQHYAVTVLDFYTATGTEVFLSDDRGIAIDVDGDPENGLTPILRLPDGTSFEQALSALEEHLLASAST
ncbi:DUF7572 family protein [Gordonia sp. DT101]|uniref:DUF7572 family protein n=1 Tax=Gordonia sp. DT101 TaxID=3416545 RepID=UPI003CF86D5A